MTTSGNITYNETRDQIIADSLSLLGVISSGGTPTANDVTYCSNQLNKMIKAWQAQGIHLWKETEAVIPLVNGQNKYVLSASSTDKMGDDPIETTLNAVATGSTLVVISTTGMTAADKIGIALDNNTMTWTTIVSVDSATGLTITAPVSSTASSGNKVISYTNTSSRPFNITNIRYLYNNGIERRIKKMGRTEFMSLVNKMNPGTVTAWYYSPQLTNGFLYVWLTPNNVNDVLHLSYIKTIQDFTNSSDTPDLPQEWLEPLTLNLACRVAPAYGLTLSKTNPELLQDAKLALAEMNGWDSEEGSVYFYPSRRDDN